MDNREIARELVKVAKALTSAEKKDLDKLHDTYFKELRNVKKGIRGSLRPLMDMIEIAEQIEKGNYVTDRKDPSIKLNFHSVQELKKALKLIQSIDKDLM